MCNFQVYKWKNAYIEDLNVHWGILMNLYVFIYLKEEVGKGGGVELMRVYLLEHSKGFTTEPLNGCL